MDRLTLFLRPGMSQDRDGPVDPIPSNAPPDIIAGQWGDAWSGNANGLSVPRNPSRWPATQGTAIAWFRFPDYPSSAAANAVEIWGSPESDRMWMLQHADFLSVFRNQDMVASANIVGTANPAAWNLYTIRRDGGSVEVFIGTQLVAVGSLGSFDTASTSPLRMARTQGLGSPAPIQPGASVHVEAAAFYDTALSDEDIHDIRTMPEAWTWRSLQGLPPARPWGYATIIE